MLGTIEVLEPVLTEIAERDVVGSSSATSSRVALETSTCPPCPAAQIRAARCTSKPT